MKFIGIILLAIGIGLLMYIGLDYYLQSKRIVSPIPHSDGVKVIILTPAPSP